MNTQQEQNPILDLFSQPQAAAAIPTGSPKPSMRAIVTQLKEADQDFEWYPTTPEIINALCRSVKAHKSPYDVNRNWDSSLDIGAGNGKVLLALKEKCDLREMHAIEKSSILCAQMDPDIMVVGTEFREQSLLSKTVDVIFSNPPYSEFEEWAEKIIRESASYIAYLVLPIRWKESQRIKDALKFRDTKAEVVGDFDFENAERQARAKVNLIRISFLRDTRDKEDDAYERFFNDAFKDLIGKFDGEEAKPTDHNSYKKQPEEEKEIVVGPDYPQIMVNLYNQEMEHIQRNYHLVGQLDADLLREFEIFPATVMKLLRDRTNRLRSIYWTDLFNHLTAITDRLTSKSRKLLLEKLNKHVSVDFTVPNIYEVIVWVIKNANIYLEKQFIDTYEFMIEKANVELYKSNKKVWEDYEWKAYRYDGKKDAIRLYKLNYRIVTHRTGGMRPSWSSVPELCEPGAELLGDLLTIARNLGFDTHTCPPMLQNPRAWVPGKSVSFFGSVPGATTKPGGHEILEAKAFLNGNVHLRFNQKLMLAMNVEHGRLKGWLRTPAEAVEELQEKEAAQFFNTHIQIGSGSPSLLLT